MPISNTGLSKESKKEGSLVSSKIADKYFSKWEKWFWGVDDDVTDEDSEFYLNKSLEFYLLSFKQGNLKANYNIYSIYKYKNDLSTGLKYLKKYIDNFCDEDQIILLDLLAKHDHRGVNFDNAVVFSKEDLAEFLSIIGILFRRNNELDIQPQFLLFLKRLDENYIDRIYEEFCTNCFKYESSFGEYYLFKNNVAKSISHLEIGEKNNSSLCCKMLGDIYFGYYGNDYLNYEKAIFYYEKAIKLGNEYCKICLARVFEKKGDISYYGRIVQLYKDSLNAYEDAYAFLGQFYLKQNELEKSTYYFSLGHSNGNVLSSAYYANNLKNGTGCSQDLEASIDILEKIDDTIQSINEDDGKEYSFVYAILCDIYFTNKYFRKNYKKAFAFAKKGTDLGDFNCTYILGQCYVNGYGTEPDKEKGRELVEMAFENGFRITEPNNSSIAYANPKPELNLEFYVNQIIQKDFLIKKQQDEISKLIDRIIVISEDTNAKIDSISKKISELLDCTSSIKKALGQQLTGLSTDTEEFETKASEISNVVVNNVKTEKYDDDKTTIYEFEKLFGQSNWDKLSNDSKRYLVTARVVFSTLLLNSQDENIDFSSVCLMICKAIENELKNRFVFRFIKYLDGKFNKDYSLYHAQLTVRARDGKYKLRNVDSITLGDYAYILCAGFTKNRFIDYYDESREQIIDFCNEVVFNKKIDSNYLNILSNGINKIKNDYRNPSCHVSSVSLVTAKDCVDYVLDYTKFLINFISDCKPL